MCRTANAEENMSHFDASRKQGATIPDLRISDFNADIFAVCNGELRDVYC